ncbi:FecCD family ABC transporter permease [Methylobacterium sp. JK268]
MSGPQARAENRLAGRLPAGAGAALALGALVLAVALAFGVGRYPVGLADVARVLAAKLTGAPSGLPAAVEAVVWQIRGPRILAAILVGAALSGAGTAFQGLFRNPLVSPDILGASSGAALGAVLGILLALGVLAIEALAFAGGLLAVAAVYAVGAGLARRDPVLVLVLAGVVIGSLLGAGVGLVKVLADPYNQLPAITFWLLGSLSGVRGGDLLALGAPILVGTVLLLLLRWRLDALSLPDEEARALGLPTGRLRVAVVGAATLVTAASVAAAGIVGWVGLVVPHLARFLVGPGFARLLPAACLLGGGTLLVIDTLARSIAPVEVPLGILTAIVGTPVFLWLLAGAEQDWS